MRLGMALLLVGATGVPVLADCIPPPPGEGPGLTMKLHLTVEATSSQGGPSEGISVTFLDTAPPPKERGLGLRIGTTDANGKLDRHITYTWSDYFSGSRRPDSGTFDLLIGLEVVHAAVECLPIVGQERRLAVAVVADHSIILE